jgi:predicted metal-dependent peptidase
MSTETLSPEELAEKLSQQEKQAPAKFTNADVNKAMESLSLVNSLLLTGLKSGQQTAGDKAFYAHFLNRMKVQWSNKLPTAGVSITDKINFYINPLFFNSLDTIQQMELVEHEIEHIVYLHPLRAKDYIGTEKNTQGRFKCANIAMDAYINENKPNLCRDLGVTYERLNKELAEMGSPFRVDKSDPWEVNYEKLMQAAKDNPNGSGAGGFGDPIDDHSQWSESTENGVGKEVAEGIVRDAANKAQQATGAGNMPVDMLKQISELNKSRVNWKKIFRQRVSSVTRFEFERTRNRRNRRYGIIQPGRKKRPEVDVVVIGDESGSMSDYAVTQIFSEIDAMADAGANIKYIAMDSDASKPIEYKKGMKMSRTRCGGTIYQPGIDLAKSLKPSLIIVVGDMDSADTPTDPKIPFIWCVVGKQTPPGNFGTVLYVEEERK